jgi:hypothetical protein
MVRKIIAATLLCATLITLFGTSFVLSSHENDEYIYSYENETVSFDHETPFSEQQMQKIANSIFGIEDAPMIMPLAACSHTLVSGSATSTSHKVYSSGNRCVRYIYSISICNKCNYIASQTLTGSSPINCCS